MNIENIKKLAGELIMVGFRGEAVTPESNIVKRINELNIGGVWLVDNFNKSSTGIGNISSPAQLKKLLTNLKEFTRKDLLVSIDAEGGNVIRLKEEYGFPKTFSAGELGDLDDPEATYKNALQIAKTLKEYGININLAPVVDLDLNPGKPPLGLKRRCFSKDPEKTILHAEAFIKAHEEEKVVTTVKHFPGHGSSAFDTHTDEADITEIWQDEELLPFEYFLKNKKAPGLLTSHLKNKKLDENFPVSISKKIVTDEIRNKYGYDGLIISDDIDMNAVSKFFSFDEVVAGVINSGSDIILCGNVLDYKPEAAKLIYDSLITQVEKGIIPQERIVESYERIQRIKKNYNITA